MKILFLSTWFPYPPNQGSKIRAYYLLKALTQDHDVALLSFEDGNIEPEWRDHIGQMCRLVRTVERDPFLSDKKESLLGWFSLRPSAVRAIYSAEMADLVQEVASQWNPDCVVALTFVMAPYALQVDGVPNILDVDNLMTRMLYESYQMEAISLGKFRRWLAYKKFESYEKWLCPQFDRCLAVAPADQRALIEMLGSMPEQIQITPNGVDTSFFETGIAEPIANTLVYHGALTYNANFDAMKYFVDEIFPEVSRQIPDVKLRITGKTDGVAVDQLLQYEGVELTGYLEDIRPTVASSWVCVVPLRVGGGTRLKILEAMALGTPVISTTKGAEGLNITAGEHLLIADTPEEFAAATVRLLKDPMMRERISQNAAQRVRESYDWVPIGKNLCTMIEVLVK